MGFGFGTDIENTITSAANRYGIDPVAMLAIAKIESGGNPRAQNPNSSAGGLFQFIDSTARQYGLDDRFNASQASDAAARLARDNSAHLRGVLGRDPTPGELYLAHQQGAGGAARLLRDPSARAVDVVGRDAAHLNGGNADMSAADFARIWTGRADNLAGTPYQPPQAGGQLGYGMATPQLQQQQGVSNEAFQAALARQNEPKELTRGEKFSRAGQALMALDGGGSDFATFSSALQSIQGNPLFNRKQGFFG